MGGREGLLGVGIVSCEGWGSGAGCVCSARVEAEHCVRVQRVQCCPAAVPVVGEFGVAAVPRDAVFLPLLDVGLGDVAVVLGIACAVHQICNLAEGFDANDALQCQIGLEWKPASEIVCTDCGQVSM